MSAFKLSEPFLEKYRDLKPPFGFNGLGEIIYQRTYSRIKPDGLNEQWWETVKRVVEWTFSMQKNWIEKHRLGLWAAGAPVTEERQLYASLNNCSFVSTGKIKEDQDKPFRFLMDMSMLGVGVGFDLKGAGLILVKGINNSAEALEHIIPDSREGWVESIGVLIRSYFNGGAPIKFDYSQIRPYGALIKGFGGVSAGAEPLALLHDNIHQVLKPLSGSELTGRAIADIMNMIAQAVIAGNVRRSAEIVFGDPDDSEFINLKNYKLNPDREAYGWASNNSIFAEVGMDYEPFVSRIIDNGEPGFFWLRNAREYGRMHNGPDNRDHRVEGANPCVEQSLESYELCCLVETFPFKHETLEDYIQTLKYAYLYAKTVTLGETHWSETNRVMLRNRRIGTSMSGIAQFIDTLGIDTLKEWMDAGYDALKEYDTIYSDWLAIPKSIKITSVKPSGTVSLLAGATPGLHYPESKIYIRRIRISNESFLIPALKKAGYHIEPDVTNKETTSVISVPVKIEEDIRTINEVSIWEQVAIASFLQQYWSDNQVSCTVSFNPETEGKEIANVLNIFQYNLKGISFLPRKEQGAYAQMPYEAIDEKIYKKMSKKLKPLDFSKVKGEEIQAEKFCDNDVCQIDFVGD